MIHMIVSVVRLKPTILCKHSLSKIQMQPSPALAHLNEVTTLAYILNIISQVTHALL